MKKMNLDTMSIVQKSGFYLGIILFIFFVYFHIIPDNHIASNMFAVVVFMSVWWITEAAPLGVTSLFPLLAFPFLGISDAGGVSTNYMNSTIFLFLGGFLLAIAIENWNLHKRIALIIILLLGTSQIGIIAGYLFSSALISSFINNTATAMLLFPIGLSVIAKLNDNYSDKQIVKFSIALMLSIAYGSSIGGITTLIGTQPNLIFLRIFKLNFPKAPDITFTDWLVFGVPISVLMLISTLGVLYFLFLRKSESFQIDSNLIKNEYKSLSKMSYEEKILSLILLLAGMLWVFRSPINLGGYSFPGWSQLLTYGKNFDDGSVAMFIGLLLFLLPAKNKNHQSTILNISALQKVPWEIILLFGGGFALADGFQKSGLSGIIGNQLMFLNGVHPFLIVLIICTLVTFMTELTSNTALTQIILPILAAISISSHIHPLLLMIPATISASFAFMLPVGTPPNAIVFGSGRIHIKDMATAGLYLNFIGVIIVTLVFYFLGNVFFKIDPFVMPSWMK
jgi:sodium-dependent dicarboxylate transporter 2/3/5